jgi:hypothetical protein
MSEQKTQTHDIVCNTFAFMVQEVGLLCVDEFPLERKK